MKTLLILALMTTTTFAAKVDLKKSTFIWEAYKVVGTGHQGTIKMKSASFDGNKGTFVADMNSMDVTDLEGEWKTKFLTHVKSADFFDVKKHKTSTLTIEKIDNNQLYGTLSLKGKKVDVTMPVTKKDKTYTGTLAFDRTELGLRYGSGSFFKNLGDKAISDTIRLKVKVVTK